MRIKQNISEKNIYVLPIVEAEEYIAYVSEI